MGADGIFSRWRTARCVVDEIENRPIVVDSGRNLAEFESRESPFEIKSEKI
jgi:hypothetical protein